MNSSLKDKMINIALIIALVMLVSGCQGSDEINVTESERTDENLDKLDSDVSEAADGGDEIQYISDYPDYVDSVLYDINGDKIRLSEYEGNFLVLAFFATWCDYCMEELPQFQEVYNAYEGDDLKILLINATQTEKSEEAVIDWYKRSGLTLPLLLDRYNDTSYPYPVQGYPWNYIINKDGKVLAGIPGALSKEDLIIIIEDYNK